MRGVTSLLIAAFLCSFLLVTPYYQVVRADLTPLVRVIPETMELGPQDVIGQIFTVAIVIEDVAGLQGISIEFAWNTTYLQYHSHTMTMPADIYSSVQPPSPYAGILTGGIWICDTIDLPNGIYEVAYGTFGFPSFTGSGTVFVISFRVIDQPQLGEEDVTLEWDFISTELADSQANSISHQVRSGTVIIHTYPWNIADINQDLKVDIFDIILACEAYGSTPEESNWNPLVDVAPLWNRIDIFDIVTIGYHYGEEYTP